MPWITKWTPLKFVFCIRRTHCRTWTTHFIMVIMNFNRFRKWICFLVSSFNNNWSSRCECHQLSHWVSSTWEGCYGSFTSLPRPRIYNTDSLSRKNRGALNSSAFDRLHLAVRLNEIPHKFNSSLPRAVNHRVTLSEIYSTTLDIQNISWASAYGNLIASSGTNWDSLYPDHTGTKWKPPAAKSNICQRPPIRRPRQLWV